MHQGASAFWNVVFQLALLTAWSEWERMQSLHVHSLAAAVASVRL